MGGFLEVMLALKIDKNMILTRNTETKDFWFSPRPALRDFMRRCKPDFTFTSIQIVQDYASALHVDGNNLGPSYILALGDYDGGELYLHGVGKVNIKNVWYCFDGHIPHLTCPIKSGQRLSIIFYTLQKYTLKPPEQIDELKRWGVNRCDVVVCHYCREKTCVLCEEGWNSCTEYHSCWAQRLCNPCEEGKMHRSEDDIGMRMKDYPPKADRLRVAKAQLS